MIKRLLKIFGIYFLSSATVSLLLAVIYKLTGATQTWGQVFIYAFMKTLNCSTEGVKSPFNDLNILTVFNQFFGQVLFVIMTGYAVTAIYSFSKKYIVLSDKMIIRKRTSANSENDITLSVMTGNKNHYNFYNVQCVMTFFYYTPEDSNETKRHTHIFEPFPEIVNFYRFSFSLEDLPAVFWETILNKTGINYNEAEIEIRLTGKFDMSENETSVRKRYRMSDIIIAKETKEIISRETKNGILIGKSKPKWSNINKIVEYSETERKQIVAEIEKYVCPDEALIK